MIGIRECNQFFMYERDNTPFRGITLRQFLDTEFDLLKPHVKRYLEKHEDSDNYRRKAYTLYYGSLTNFRPLEAIKLYERVKAQTVLDPCAGWGGRCYGAMEYGANYIGFDTNINLKKPYQLLISSYNKKQKKVEIYFEDSAKADFSKFSYDTVLTSPPYYKREPYNNMPSYRSPKEFKEAFLDPMITNSFRYLTVGGHLCINVPQKMYGAIKDIMGRECDFRVEYKKIKRNITNYEEYIYCWIKTS